MEYENGKELAFGQKLESEQKSEMMERYVFLDFQSDVCVIDLGLLTRDKMFWRTFKDPKDPEKLPYKRIGLELQEVNKQGAHKELIVPISVYKEMQGLIEEYGDKMRKVKVKRHGEGLLREYKVLPLF